MPKIVSFSIAQMFLLFAVCFLSSGCPLLERGLNKEGVEEREVLGYVYEYKYNPKVEELQKMLQELRYEIKLLDGRMGEVTRESIKLFQQEHGLKASGYVDKKTWVELNASYQKETLSFDKISAEKIQTALKNAGFDPGPTDGKIGLKTTKAIIEFQKSKGLKQDKKVNPETWEQLKEYLLIDKYGVDGCRKCRGE